MYPIDNKFSAIMWAQTIARAQAGDQMEMEILQSENQVRADNNQPKVEQELTAMLLGADKQI